ncbi:hypothetical protein ACC806_34590 [Rhizobium ruizarguesonis]
MNENYAWKERYPHSEVFSVSWVIDAPWAHPMWSQYLVTLYDLTTPHKDGIPTLHLKDATHEFLVHALDLRHQVPRDVPPSKVRIVMLQPANYGYQFKADSDEAAEARIQELVSGIVAGKLSPDTDFRSLWNKLLPDMYPLVHSGLVI